MSAIVNCVAYTDGRRIDRQNDVMKRFAGWASIIAVPTMIAGIYGMNVKFMPELTTPFGYPVVMLIIIGSCGFLYRHFKRSGWL